MTKLEFAIKLENYQKRRRKSKWEFYIIGIVSLALAFTPSSILYFNDSMFNYFALLGVFYIFKALEITNGTEEQELLVNAIDLLSPKRET